VYVVFVVGESEGEAELLVNPAGLLTHAYELAPVEVKVALEPVQIFTELALAVITGFGLIVITIGYELDTQPEFELVTVILKS